MCFIGQNISQKKSSNILQHLMEELSFILPKQTLGIIWAGDKLTVWCIIDCKIGKVSKDWLKIAVLF